MEATLATANTDVTVKLFFRHVGQEITASGACNKSTYMPCATSIGWVIRVSRIIQLAMTRAQPDCKRDSFSHHSSPLYE